MPDLTSIVLAAAAVVAVLITRGQVRRRLVSLNTDNLAALVRHALLDATPVHDFLNLRRPSASRPPWCALRELLARLVGLRMYTGQLVLYDPETTDLPQAFQISGAARSAAAFFNTMTARFASINVCVLANGADVRSLSWHDPDVGCIVWVEQIYTAFDWMPRRKSAGQRRSQPKQHPPRRWMVPSVVVTALVGVALVQAGGWARLTGTGLTLLATTGALLGWRAAAKINSSDIAATD